MLQPVSPWIEITTAGAPVRATALRTNPAERLEAHAIVFQQCPGNTGALYVFNSSSGDQTGASTGTAAIIPAPTYNDDGKPITLPHLVFSIPGTANAENVASYWVDAQVAGNKVSISILVL